MADNLKILQAVFDSLWEAGMRPAKWQPYFEESGNVFGELCVRARNVINALGVTTIAQLASLSENDLLEFKNFGFSTLLDVKVFLKKHGLSLRPETQPPEPA